MRIIIDDGGRAVAVDAKPGDTVLDAFQKARIPIEATCGGAGVCKRCKVLVRAQTGSLDERLACLTQAEEGLEVVALPSAPIAIVGGTAHAKLHPAPRRRGLGMAVDVGTTTIAACLHDLDSGERLACVARENPQTAFGADVISRIEAAGEGKLALMQSALACTLSDLRRELLDTAGVAPTDALEVVLCGNTVMEHIACGLSPVSIGSAPYAPLSLFGEECAVRGFARPWVAPAVAGFLGGDVVCDLLAKHYDEGRCRLLLDLGTNGEMALALPDALFVCATAAGPVFEAAGLACGMPASAGAISSVRWTGTGFAAGTIEGAHPRGLCGTGLVDAVAALLDAGIVDETGRMLKPDELADAPARCVDTVEGETRAFLTSDRSVFLTQRDVRAFQLAKAAIRGGMETLFDHAGIDAAAIERIELAGGMGKFLDVRSAARCGLIPPELADRTTSIGNTALEGAAVALVDRSERAHARSIARSCTYLELSDEPAFKEHYLDEMGFDDDDD